MTSDEIRAVVIEGLRAIAPEADLDRLPHTAPFREELDIDSMDFLKLVTFVHERLHVDVPEREYAKLATIEGATAYLAARLGSR